MQILSVRVHNFRSLVDATFQLNNYTLLVGPNNVGKSNVISALRVFYEDLNFAKGEDWPRLCGNDEEAWIQVEYLLDDEEHSAIREEYRRADKRLVVRKLLISKEHPAKVKQKQSNLYAVLENNVLEENLFYGAKNVSQAKLGEIVYIPSVSLPADALKTSGPSPLRDTLNFVLKRVVGESAAYQDVRSALEKLTEEGTSKDGFLDQVMSPINQALNAWNIRLQFKVEAISPEEITKTLIKTEVLDVQHGESPLALDHFGQGFQRSLIYELIQLAAKVKKPESARTGYNPRLDLLLFEEPEAFLHPHQQEALASRLRLLGNENSQQVVLTTHSPLFVSRTTDDLCSIVRLSKKEGRTAVHQISRDDLVGIFHEGMSLRTCLQAYVDNSTIPESRKSKARKALAGEEPDPAVAEQEEFFRFQLWLDDERCAMFFAEQVVLVEGPTEKALFNYLLANTWNDLRDRHIFVVDALGKFNMHRFMALFERFGIRHSVLLDSDMGKNEHGAVNDMIVSFTNTCTIADPYMFDRDLEKFLGLSLPARNDRKPIAVLKALNNNDVAAGTMASLREIFTKNLLGAESGETRDAIHTGDLTHQPVAVGEAAQ